MTTLWLMNLALALAGGLPIGRALADTVGPRPGADVLAEAFSFEVLADLGELRPGLVAGFVNVAGAFYLLGLVVGLVVTGGALEVLTSADERPFAHRFGRGFRFFGRFLRLGALTLAAAALLSALTAGPLFALGRYARRESGSEWLSLGVLAAAFAVLGLTSLLALLVQDAARVGIVREDARRVVPALAAGVRLVLHSPVAWLSTWAANALLLVAAFGVYLALSGTVALGSRLAVLVALQQGFVLARCGLRVALLGSEVALVPGPAPPVARTAQAGGAESPPV